MKRGLVNRKKGHGRIIRESSKVLPCPPFDLGPTSKEMTANVSSRQAQPSNSTSFDLSFGTGPNNDGFLEMDNLIAKKTTSTPRPCSTFKNPRRESVFPHQLFVSPCTEQRCNVSTGMEDNSKLIYVQGSFLATPSKSTPNKLLLSNWGLPEIVLEQYLKRGIKSMFEWQNECLLLPNVLDGGNLVISAPTSAGKTLVAELIALKCVLESRRKVMIILPFVSVAHEKANYLQSIFEPHGVRVGGFMGNQSPVGGFAGVDIAICTIEKANSLVNRLLEERAIHEIGTVVVDEVHMLGDQHRGYLLEILLTKIMFIERVGKISLKIQLIGMSATLPNGDAIARWLNAQFYSTDFRPTPLKEMVKIGSTLYDSNFKKLREFDPAESIPGDEDDILLICREHILEGHSILIFCPTKAWCENLASTLAEALGRFAQSSPAGNGHSVGSPELVGVCEQLRRTQVGLDRVLKNTIPNCVAFHHAGLTFEEREIVEGAFRQSLVKILVATSTLSCGVNLPARLVILRTPYFQRSLLDVLVYKQMSGRAGRKGVDKVGESILMCKPKEKSKVVELFKCAPKPVQSCLWLSKGLHKSGASAGKMFALKRALLEVIASGVAVTKQEIEVYSSCTLFYAELKSTGGGVLSTDDASNHHIVANMSAPVDETVTFLLNNDFISSRTKPIDHPSASDDGLDPVLEFYATQLGLATVASALSPDEALVVFNELRRARRSFVLESELHTIYLVTPVYVQDQWPNIDWYKYLCLWERLPEDMKHVSDTLGVSESFLAQAVQGRLPKRTESQCESLRLHQRFFTALALHDLVHEVPITLVARRYGATKGLLQTLQSAAGTFSGMVTIFCNRLGWKNLELLLSQFQSRLTFGVERELCDLVIISLLNGFRARVLYNAGYHTLAALASANPKALETILRNAFPFKSNKLSVGEDGEVESSRNTTWCAKLRKGMSEREAAELIATEAKLIISKRLSVPLSAWDTVRQKACGISQQLHQEMDNSAEMKVDSIATQKQRKRTRSSHDRICDGEHRKVSNNYLPTLPRQREKMNSASALDQELVETHSPEHVDVLDSQPVGSPPLDLSPITAHVCNTTNEQAKMKPFLNRNTSLIGMMKSEGDGSRVEVPLSIPDSFVCTPDSSSFEMFAMIDATCDTENNKEEVTSDRKGIAQKSPLQTISHRENAGQREYRQSVDTSIHITPTRPVNISRSEHFHLSGLKELSSLCSSQISQNGLTVISVTSNHALFDTFVSECMEQTAVAFSVACTGVDPSECIGSTVLKSKSFAGLQIRTHLNQQVVGIAFCWGGMDVYYVSLCHESVESSENTDLQQFSGIQMDDRISAMRKLFGENRWRNVIAYDMKKHAKRLALACGMMPAPTKARDPIVASWILDPDAREKTIHKMVLQYLSGQPLLSECEDYEEVPLSSVATNVGNPEMQASAESVLSFLLISVLETLLKAEDLYDAYVKLEMPSLLVLAKIELNGIGFSPDECTEQRDILQCRLTELEQEAYGIAGHTFSLTSPEDIASVLFFELQLPPGSDAVNKQGAQRSGVTRRPIRKKIHHLSTAKDVLEKIRPLHPMPGLVLEWRRISTALTKMVYPLLKCAVSHPRLQGSSRIYPSVQIHTATGRVSVSDPSLQMVPKAFDIGSKTVLLSLKACPLMSDSQYLEKEGGTNPMDATGSSATKPSSVCIRNVFQSFPQAIFLAADYSQLELRMLAQMSGDEKLRQFLNGDGDVFKMIAAEWLELPASGVSDEQRQDAKQVCYGMIYGIGPKALGEQLGITGNEAAQFMETFRSKYPMMRKFISNVIQGCRDKGYVSTILGRKRFLSGIHSVHVHARSQAERQAINTTIQGSAADLVKTAMVNIDKMIDRRYQNSTMCLLPSSCGESCRHAAYLVLQLHDELLYEVLETDLEEVARIVRHEMENALELDVKFPVKLKAGYSWGNLNPM